jgi:hypothetical protein
MLMIEIGSVFGFSHVGTVLVFSHVLSVGSDGCDYDELAVVRKGMAVMR